ncbi:MAG: hypothetical protein J1F66_05535 [Clostridiales bacterium]|nr:hypothetical protein [Clostridiales bacterium]
MIIDELYNKFPNMQDLRMREIRVDKKQRRVFCKLSYPNMPNLSAELKSELSDCIKSLVPQGFSCSIDFLNDSFTVTGFLNFIYDLIKSKYPVYGVIPKHKIDVGIAERKITVILSVSAAAKHNMETSEFAEKLVEFFDGYTCYDVDILLREDDSDDANVAEQERLVRLAVNREFFKPSRYFAVKNVRKHIGKEFTGSPMYIVDVRNPLDSCIICGVVSNKSIRAAKNNNSMQVCKFTLSDASGASMNCVIFVKFLLTDVATIQDTTGKTESEAKTLAETRTLANDKKMKLLLQILNGDSVIVKGRVAYNAYSERLEMTVYDLAKCEILPASAQQKFTREVEKEYLLVRPEQYSEYQQTNFVFQPSQNSVLKGRNIVVLHANTTGFNTIEDKVYAICGVKVSDGRVTERFFTYVNPEKEIDGKILALCEMLENKLSFYPTLTEIISDLYKFTYNCELVGNNLAQLLELLNYYAAPVGYQFANNTALQNDLLAQLFENSLLNVSVSVAKLEDVAKKCKVPCKSTVFCKETALTVARCMSILSDNAK